MNERSPIPNLDRGRSKLLKTSIEMVMLAVSQGEHQQEEILGIGQYALERETHRAEVAFVVKDEYQNQGIGIELMSYLTYLAKRHRDYWDLPLKF